MSEKRKDASTRGQSKGTLGPSSSTPLASSTSTKCPQPSVSPVDTQSLTGKRESLSWESADGGSPDMFSTDDNMEDVRDAPKLPEYVQRVDIPLRLSFDDPGGGGKAASPVTSPASKDKGDPDWFIEQAAAIAARIAELKRKEEESRCLREPESPPEPEPSQRYREYSPETAQALVDWEKELDERPFHRSGSDSPPPSLSRSFLSPGRPVVKYKKRSYGPEWIGRSSRRLFPLVKRTPEEERRRAEILSSPFVSEYIGFGVRFGLRRHPCHEEGWKEYEEDEESQQEPAESIGISSDDESEIVPTKRRRA